MMLFEKMMNEQSAEGYQQIMVAAILYFPKYKKLNFSKQAADGSQKQRESSVSAKQKSLRNLNKKLIEKKIHSKYDDDLSNIENY
ncbi:MAG: hypothetical protein PHG06_09030 [Parabacteroides sp.]|nr:hypothetical protein [Parabacteroides sp.]